MPEAAPEKLSCPICQTRYDGGRFCAKDGSPLVHGAASAGADRAGQVLAERYRLIRLIGEGGMGQVYEAEHLHINKQFAIKLLRPEAVGSASALLRFHQEARSASSIGHHNIVEIDDFAALPDGTVYLAMERLIGESLAERMKRGPLPLASALDILGQVCEGLSAAHAKSIVHRDLKPENVFLTERAGRLVVKILDFGIAKVSGGEGDANLTRTGAIFGTPRYMSPEQAGGHPVDHRTDVYALGVIMYELFAGQPPFTAESALGILHQHVAVAPRSPREVAPDRRISAALEAIILQAMAKSPDDRQRSMSDLSAALRAVLVVDKSSSEAVSIDDRGAVTTARRARRTPLTWGAGALLIGSLVWVVAIRGRANRAAPIRAPAAAPVPAVAAAPAAAPVPAVVAVPAAAPVPAVVAAPAHGKTHPRLEDRPSGKRVALDPLDSGLDAFARQAAVGSHRMGSIYRGRAEHQNEHSDWFVRLEAGHCYTFIGRGGAGLRKLSLYLWGPDGKRVTDRRSNLPDSLMPYCAPLSGPFHLQAKAGEGQGEYRVGIYR